MLRVFHSLHESMNKHLEIFLNVEIIILTSGCLSPDKQRTNSSQAGGHIILVFEETDPCLGRLALPALKHPLAQSYLQSHLIHKN